MHGLTTAQAMTIKRPRPKAARGRRLEENLQCAMVEWLGWAAPKPPDFVVWHTPNGGDRSKSEAGRLKGMGVLPGVPDLGFQWRARVMWFEVKPPANRSPMSRLSAEQRRFRDACFYQGVSWAVGDSIADLARFLVWEGVRLKDKEAQRRAADAGPFDFQAQLARTPR